MQTLMDCSQSLQSFVGNSSLSCQAAEFQKLRNQHAQLLDFNHVLIEENNHRLVDHAELMSEVWLDATPQTPASLARCLLLHHPALHPPPPAAAPAASFHNSISQFHHCALLQMLSRQQLIQTQCYVVLADLKIVLSASWSNVALFVCQHTGWCTQHMLRSNQVS